MLDLQFTPRRSSTLWQLMGFLLADIITLSLLLMTRLTEMRRSPAKPLRQRTTEATLKLDEVVTVFGTVLDASADAYGRALATDEFLRLEIAIFLTLFAIFHATEIGFLAFEADVIGELVESVGFEVVVVDVFGILQPRCLVYILVLSSLQGHLYKIIFELLKFINSILKLGTMVALDALLAGGATQESEDYTGARPLLLHLLQDAVQVKEVGARELYYWGFTQASYIANRAVIVDRLAVGRIWVLLNALLVETRQAIALASKAAAVVFTGKDLVAALVHHVHAFVLATDVAESRLSDS